MKQFKITATHKSGSTTINICEEKNLEWTLNFLPQCGYIKWSLEEIV